MTEHKRRVGDDVAMDVAVEIVTLELGLITSKNKDEFMRKVDELMSAYKCHKPVKVKIDNGGGDVK